MTYFDYLDSIISEMVDDIEDKVEDKIEEKIEEKGLYKLGFLEFIKQELEERIDRYIKKNIKFEV